MKLKRVYEKPKTSVLILGPRGTGKSTFVKDDAKPDLSIDLLKTSTYRELSLHPSRLEDWVSHLKPHQWVLIDEVQKIPELFDEVHRLIENFRIRFILTGSSARKIKQTNVNLLAGRAVSKKMLPLCLHEINGKFSIEHLLSSGCLPRAVTEPDSENVNDFLFSYVETYLKEEIFQEGLVRNLQDFSRFVELAGQYHGQILNYENLSRELGKSGDTIKAWFQILQDTLVGYLIEPYPLHLYPKETKHPRFYYFDCGVARAAEGIQDLTEIPERKGFYFETLILNELKVYFEVRRKHYKIFFYNVSTLGDIDFIVEVKRKSLSTPAQLVAIEVKLTKVWKPEFEKVLNTVLEHKKTRVTGALAIYLGNRQLTKNKLQILPVVQFVEMLWRDELF